MSGPLFSIGVTTYDRLALLKQTLASVAGQRFTDFEAIVGNDCVAVPLSADTVGIDDARVRIVNHPENLGEARNMNALLSMARGRYFTWLADDDLYAAGFLEAAHTALTRLDWPRAVFTGFASGAEYVGDGERVAAPPIRRLTGREFIREYLARSLKTIGCYALFETAYLRAVGGIQQLGTGFSPYSDNLLALQCGLLDSVAYVDAPLVFFRTHAGAVSFVSPDLEAYASAQADLVARVLPILASADLRQDLDANLFMLLRWLVRDFTAVVRRAGGIDARRAIAYLRFVERSARRLRTIARYGRTLRFAAGAMARVILETRRAAPRRSARAPA